MAQASGGFKAFAALKQINALQTLIEFLDTGSLCSLDSALTSGPFLSVSPPLYVEVVSPLSAFFNRALKERSDRAITHRQVMQRLMAMNIALDANDIQQDMQSAYEYMGCIHFWSFRFRPTLRIFRRNSVDDRLLPPWRLQLSRAVSSQRLNDMAPFEGNFPRLPWCPEAFVPTGYIWCGASNPMVEFAFHEVPGRAVANPTSSQTSPSSSSGSGARNRPWDPVQ